MYARKMNPLRPTSPEPQTACHQVRATAHTWCTMGPGLRAHGKGLPCCRNGVALRPRNAVIKNTPIPARGRAPANDRAGLRGHHCGIFPNRAGGAHCGAHCRCATYSEEAFPSSSSSDEAAPKPRGGIHSYQLTTSSMPPDNARVPPRQTM